MRLGRTLIPAFCSLALATGCSRPATCVATSTLFVMTIGRIDG